MVLRLVLLVAVVVGLVAFFGGLIPNASMAGLFQTLPAPVIGVAYAGEINQISSLVEEFMELRENVHSAKSQEMAEKLDAKINNLQLVKMFCDEEISSLELAKQKNPYVKLQKICPELKNISFGKAVQLFRQI